MGNASRWAIGVTALVGAAATMYAALTAGALLPRGPWPVIGLSAFFGLVALACFVTSAQPVAVRIIGGVIFVAYAIYVGSSLGTEDFWRSVAGFAAIGALGGYVAFFGEHPRWGGDEKASQATFKGP